MLREAGLLKEGDLYDAHNATLVHHVNQALRAHTLFQRDKDYIVRNGEVVIIDEFTGRMMPGRRYSEGLHQALEAKERVQIQPENQTLASITFQNYFRLYKQARRHDRHGRDRGRRVPGDLQPRSGRDPDQHAGRAPGRGRRGLPDGRTRSTRRSSGRSRPPPRKRPADPGRHRPRSRSRSISPSFSTRTASRRSTSSDPEALRAALRGGARGPARLKHFAVLNARFHEQEAFIVAAGRRAGRDHHRHQHGRAAAPTSSSAATPRCASQQRDSPASSGEARAAPSEARESAGRESARLQGARRSPPAASTSRHRAPRIPAHRQPAARPLRPPGRSRAARSSTCRSRTT